MMEFSLPYQLAMREQAPKMFNWLRRTGALSAHLKAKSAEAHRMFDDLAKDKPKLPNGALRSPSDQQQIVEQVFAALIEFPSDDPDCQDETISGDQAAVSPETDPAAIQTTH